MQQKSNYTSILFQNHNRCKELAFSNRLLKHRQMLLLLEDLAQESHFEVERLGESIEGRGIFSIKAGKGPIKILLWSQMHGDEPTATMAIFDILNYLKSPSFTEKEKQLILAKTTLCFIPMLNPDGAEVYQRANAMGIDINRDARRLQSPEARILKNAYESFKPDFAFNLHDQSRYYCVGNSGIPAALSFLAPPYDQDKSINNVRAIAMKVIGAIMEQLQPLLPNQIAKFSEDFEPRSFGDNFQLWGVSTVLIESGYIKSDPEKQQLRKYNFIAILGAIHAISSGAYLGNGIKTYTGMPANENLFFDILLRNVGLKINKKFLQVDIAINREETIASSHRGFTTKTSVQEVGDMSRYFGFTEIDARRMTLLIGEEKDASQQQLNTSMDQETEVILAALRSDVDLDRSLSEIIPFIESKSWQSVKSLKLKAAANFILLKDHRVKYILSDKGLLRM